jgi:hypothetical protein
MDGMHRVCKALLQDLHEVEALRFIHDPAPDYIGVNPDDCRIGAAYRRAYQMRRTNTALTRRCNLGKFCILAKA